MTLIVSNNGVYLFHIDRHSAQKVQFTIDPNNPEAYTIVFDKMAYTLPIKDFQGMRIDLIEPQEVPENPLMPTIDKYLYTLGVKKAFCVDIGASDGVSGSNTYPLYEKGWSGLSVECEPSVFSILANNYKKFSKVNLTNKTVTPDNVLSLLQSYDVPKHLDFLDVDIDGYDYYVLDKILRDYRPTLVCAEINEKIPPPIKFSVRYQPGFTWKGYGSHYYGQSIAKVYELCEKYDYALLEMSRFVNVFLCPEEIAPHSLTPEEAYQKGYREREIPEHNKDVAELLDLTPEEGVQYVNQLFKEYRGQFDLSVE